MKNNYNTDQRKLITEYLINNENKFVNAEEILEYMQEKKQKVGVTTIYRYLNLLEKNKNVRTEIRNHTKYFQYISDECTNHFHLKCKKCGRIIHLVCDDFIEMNNHLKEKHNFVLDNNAIIYGTCYNCNLNKK